MGLDPSLNPYTPRAGSVPRAMVGRDAEIEGFELLLTRLERGLHERSMVICGLRGVGKTVLLRSLSRRALSAGWHVGAFEGRRGIDLREQVTNAVLGQLADFNAADRARDAVQRLIAWLPRFRGTVSDAGEPLLDLERRDQVTAQPLEPDLVELMERLGDAARAAGRGVVFVLDDMHELGRSDAEAWCAAMHRVGQEAMPVALVASGLPSLQGQLADATPYADRLFEYPQINGLAPEFAREAIVRPAAEVDPEVQFEPGALDRMLQFADGYPMALQAIGQQTWAVAKSRTIGEDDVAAAEARALKELYDELFEPGWQRASGRQRDYLAAIARSGGQGRSARVAQLAGFPSIRAAAGVRDDLLAKGLIWAPERGTVAFTVPRYDRFVRAVGHELPSLSRADDLGWDR